MLLYGRGWGIEFCYDLFFKKEGGGVKKTEFLVLRNIQTFPTALDAIKC